MFLPLAFFVSAILLWLFYMLYIRHKLVVGKNEFGQAFGHGIGIWRFLIFLLFLAALLLLATKSIPFDVKVVDENSIAIYYVLAWIALVVIGDLGRQFLRSPVLKLENKDKINSRYQLFILTVVTILVLIGCLFLVKKLGNIGPVIAAVIGWIFQDYIKGFISYCHLLSSGLLHIGDWIVVKKYGVSGIVMDCSLLTVTVRNWDNTISSIPMYSLQAESFQNNHEVLDGKTTGRRMKRRFIIDTSSIHVVAEEERQRLLDCLRKMGEDTIAVENAKADSLNISLFRHYLRHWLMNNDEVCRSPRLMVSLKEPQPEGVPLEVYVFILRTPTDQFVVVQSEIQEHILMTMPLFGLRLYQRFSSHGTFEDMKDLSIDSGEEDYE